MQAKKSCITVRNVSLLLKVCLGMKTVENGRENALTIPAPVFFCRKREREREDRTGKRIRYYGISETEYFDRECVDYDRESVT